MPFGHGLYLAIKNSPALQMAILVAVAIKLWLLNNFLVSRRANRKLRDRMKVETLKARIEAEDEIRTIEKEASHEADQAIDAGRIAGRHDELSDSALARTLGRSQAAARSGGRGQG